VARTPDPSEAEFVRRVREPRAGSAEPGRHRARRSAMMVLYKSDLVGGSVDQAVEAFGGEHGFPMPEYAEQLVRGVTEMVDSLDAVIGTYLKDWSVERLGAVERAVLRIATWELGEGEVPPPVVIDEAVELAKRYATPEAAKLINGVLAAWLRDHEMEEGQ
jgi:transcription antitermination protein NusB